MNRDNLIRTSLVEFTITVGMVFDGLRVHSTEDLVRHLCPLGDRTISHISITDATVVWTVHEINGKITFSDSHV